MTAQEPGWQGHGPGFPGAPEVPVRTGATATTGPADSDPLPQRQVALIDLLDRLLSGGVVLTGDVVLSIADIDLVRVSLRALIVSVRSAQGDHDDDRGHDGH